MRNPAPRLYKQRKGAAMVECAITLPLLIVMVLGVLEIGSALRASTILQSACRESGRLTAMDWRYIVHDSQTPNQKVEQDLKNFISAAGLKGSDSTVTITHADGASVGQTFDLADPVNDLQFVRVEVTLPYHSVSVFPVTYLGGKTLKASIVMRATTKGGSLSD
jgi:Flp pilus assembly protein TadG